MRILQMRTLAGPNIYHHLPVLRMTLDLEDLAFTTSDELDGFSERLLAVLPGLTQHHCSRGYPGGFVERLHEGAYFGHIVEHVALELSEPAGIPVTYGKTFETEIPAHYQVVVLYRCEPGMTFLLRTAVDLVAAARYGHPFPLAERLEEARRIIARHQFGPSTFAVIAAGQNPHHLGIGIDEDTAIIVEQEQQFRVLGSGAVYVLNGHQVSYSNISEEESDRSMSIFGMRLHVLGQDDAFALKTRQPFHPRSTEATQ